jgi:SAM-dependent methyltransferase
VSRVYVGEELELFAAATGWKAYFAGILRPYIAGRVLEVGAGIGTNVPFLHNERVASWTSLEPDPMLARRIEEQAEAGTLPPDCHVAVGTIASLAQSERYDTILYIDVLEHIDGDAAELDRARQHLALDGHLIVLAPAHQYLFTPFDAAIGHYRRYNRQSLLRLAPPDCRLVTCPMLDCAGFFASLANRLVLSAAVPSPRQVAVWDRYLVPLSRRLDAVLGYRFGKTIVAVWRATG